jgi:hypothetical protein
MSLEIRRTWRISRHTSPMFECYRGSSTTLRLYAHSVCIGWLWLVKSSARRLENGSDPALLLAHSSERPPPIR